MLVDEAATKQLSKLQDELSNSRENVTRRLVGRRRRGERFMLIRVLCFFVAAGGFAWIAIAQSESPPAVVGLFGGLIGFVVAVRGHRPVQREIGRLERLLGLIEAKAQRLDGLASGPDIAEGTLVQAAPGRDPCPIEAHTLDDIGIIGGARSVLRSIDTTSTSAGHAALRARLINSELDPTAIRERQDAVRWFLERRRIRNKLEQAFAAAMGRPVPEAIAFAAAGSPLTPEALARARFGPVASAIIAALVIGSFVFHSLTLIIAAVFVAAIANHVFRDIIRATANLRQGTEALEGPLAAAAVTATHVNESEGVPPRLQEWVDAIQHLEDGPFPLASARRAMAWLSLYKLGLVYVAWDWLFLQDVMSVGPLARFWAARGDDVVDAVKAMGEIEASIALANIADERPGWTWPEVVDGDVPRVEFEAICHPLIATFDVVPNDLLLGNGHPVAVVTGSNMSGKSTLLKTCGASLLLAQAGGPVRARSMKWTPVRLLSDINVRDSLDDGESFFSAEVHRVRSILETAASTPFCLILLDEVFRGTNTDEKVAASCAVIGQLGRTGTLTIAATHDVEPTKLADDEALGCRNYHFADAVLDGRMVFDYRLEDGPARRRNAILLLEVAGYPDAVVTEARERLQRTREADDR